VSSVEERLKELKILPVVKLERVEDAVPLAKALRDGGIPAAEITFRTACAEDVIRAITDRFPDMLVGAGTVLSRGQADAAIRAGAKFIVSPGLDVSVIRFCQEKVVPVFPGCVTATEVQQALALGLKTLKFFPAEPSGGLRVIKALSEPFPQVQWMPTGGIGLENLKEYLAFPKIIACGGSYLVPEKDIASGNWEEVTDLCRRTVAVIRGAEEENFGFEVMHVGFNQENAVEARQNADLLKTLFGFGSRETPISFFSTERIEIMKKRGAGTLGHIAIGTNDIVTAKKFLESRGVEFDDSTADYFPDGRLKLIYLKKEIAGFAFHLVQK
jgi:2-dehydro-3-deoxyphosphogluconate aldolase/(4S)-4-hydroxy-2-oxoglutarate aldolase